MSYRGKIKGARDLTLAETLKIGKLNESGVGVEIIAAVMERNKRTCERAAAMVALAKQGNKNELFAFENERNKKIKGEVWEYFNGKEEPEEKAEEKPAEQPTVQEKNEEHYFIAVLEEMREQTRLLKALCKAWGVEE